LGSSRGHQLPARRAGESVPRHLPRRLPRRQARGPRRRRTECRGPPHPGRQTPRSTGAGVGLLTCRDAPRKGPRLVPSLLRRVRGDALHRDRAHRVPARRRGLVRDGRGNRVCHLRPRPGAGIGVGESVAGREWSGLPDRPVAVLVRLGRLRGNRVRVGQSRQDPECIHRLHLLGHRVGARPARNRRRRHRVPVVRRGRLSHRGAGATAVPQALRSRPHEHHRDPDVRDPRRGHPAHPAHRGDAAVHLLRRLVAHRQLRDPPVAAAHLPRVRRTSCQTRGPGRRARAPMNRAIRRVGIGVTVLILLLVGQLTYLQVYDSDHLANDPRNIRFQLRDFSKPRGRILTSDDQVLARSVETGDELKFQRLYPQGALFSQLVGYQSFVFGNTGLERTYNNELAGRDPLLQIRNVGDLLAGKEPIGNVVLSTSASLQTAARDALGAQHGSVVVMNPKTGGIMAMYSNPSYDPQPFASHNSDAVQAYEKLLRAKPDKPDLPRAYRERFPPGSTFKVVTSSVALGTGRFTPQSVFPVRTELDLPQTNNTLKNFGGESCGGTLALSFQESCNTTFGQIGLELGNEFVPGMQKFGIGAAPPLAVAPGAADSVGPAPGSFQQNQPLFAFAGIGQGDVAVTPLQMALSASAVANKGQIMEPHVGDRITDGDDNTVKTIDPK